MCAPQPTIIMDGVPSRDGASSDRGDRGRRTHARQLALNPCDLGKGMLVNDNAADRSPRTRGRYLTRRAALGRLAGLGAGATVASATLGAFPATARGLSAV